MDHPCSSSCHVSREQFSGFIIITVESGAQFVHSADLGLVQGTVTMVFVIKPRVGLEVWTWRHNRGGTLDGYADSWVLGSGAQSQECSRVVARVSVISISSMALVSMFTVAVRST